MELVSIGRTVNQALSLAGSGCFPSRLAMPESSRHLRIGSRGRGMGLQGLVRNTHTADVENELVLSTLSPQEEIAAVDRDSVLDPLVIQQGHQTFLDRLADGKLVEQ